MKTLFATLTFIVFLCAGCSDSEPGKNEVFLNMNRFSPSSLTVTAGTTVVWENQESATHTVTSNNGVFDSGNMGNKDKFSYTFTTVGSYPYHCKFHSGMNGTIIVE